MSIVSQTSLYQEDGSPLLSLYDPVSLHDPDLSTPLKEADLLVPCGHSISHKVAQTLFGVAHTQMLSGGAVGSGRLGGSSGYSLKMWVDRTGGCPECSLPVVAYVPNCTLQSMEDSIRQIQDLFTLNPFKDAVLLLPCGDSISEELALHTYGHAHDIHVERPGACAACCRPIVGYVPNKTLRNIELFTRHVLLESNLSMWMQSRMQGEMQSRRQSRGRMRGMRAMKRAFLFSSYLFQAREPIFNIYIRGESPQAIHTAIC